MEKYDLNSLKFQILISSSKEFYDIITKTCILIKNLSIVALSWIYMVMKYHQLIGYKDLCFLIPKSFICLFSFILLTFLFFLEKH